jgi:hypothetical protein
MPSRHRCYLLTPTDNVEVSLRRFAYGDDVPKCGRQEARYPGADIVTYGVHDAEVEIAREVGTVESSLDGDHTGKTIAHDDPRWPATCACGYVFKTEDRFQENRSRLYKRSDNGELVALGNAPVGALYDSGTFKDIGGYNRNGDGMSLVCKTPAGEWLMDGPASNGPGWTRTGTPPDIDVTPSIGIGSPMRMHGWLRNGWLEIDSP